jgi:hypothetical protein
MKRISIDEQIAQASRKVDEWPQLVRDATELKVSSRYFNERSLREESADEKAATTDAARLALQC